MSEIQLMVQDQYMAAFLELIKTLPYIEIQQIKPVVETKSTFLFEQIPVDAPIRRGNRTTRKSKKSLDVIVGNQNYLGTNLDNLETITVFMDSQEPIEAPKINPITIANSVVVAANLQEPIETQQQLENLLKFESKLKNAFREVRQIKEGKKTGIPLSQLINEL